MKRDSESVSKKARHKRPIALVPLCGEGVISVAVLSVALLPGQLGANDHSHIPTIRVKPVMETSEKWYPTIVVQGVVGENSDSQVREAFAGGGVIFSADYLERFGITVGYNHSSVNFLPGIGHVEQDSILISGRINTTPDALDGHIGYRVDLHQIYNDDPTGSTDRVTAVAPVISYAPFDGSWYADIGGAVSSYPRGLNVMQFSPTLGFAFNEKADWLTFRPNYININDDTRSSGREEAYALDIKYTHWLDPDNPLKLNNIKLNGMVGEKIYAVDMDGAVVYNLADIHQGSLSMGLEWHTSDHLRLQLMASHDIYEDGDTAIKYYRDSLYLSYAYDW